MDKLLISILSWAAYLCFPFGFLLMGKLPMEARPTLPDRWTRSGICLASAFTLLLYARVSDAAAMVVGYGLCFLWGLHARTRFERWDERGFLEKPT